MELIKFNALLKSTLWGGEKIVPFKHLSTEQHNVGENWEISGVPVIRACLWSLRSLRIFV